MKTNRRMQVLLYALIDSLGEDKEWCNAKAQLPTADKLFYEGQARGYANAQNKILNLLDILKLRL